MLARKKETYTYTYLYLVHRIHRYLPTYMQSLRNLKCKREAKNAMPFEKRIKGENLFSGMTFFETAAGGVFSLVQLFKPFIPWVR